MRGRFQLTEAMLTVGGIGRVKGDVVVREVIVHGTLTGNVQAHDRVEITPSGSLIGDVTTSRITIADGAHFKGSIEIGQK